MTIRWAARTVGEDAEVVALGDVEAPDRQRALEAARRRWPAVRLLRVQSHASLAVAAEEERARQQYLERLVTVSEAAELTGLAARRIYEAMETGELLAVRGRSGGSKFRRIDPRALRRWMAERRDGDSDVGAHGQVGDMAVAEYAHAEGMDEQDTR